MFIFFCDLRLFCDKVRELSLASVRVAQRLVGFESSKMNFANKVAIITGAGSGIGKAIALKFAKLSATLSLIDINKNNLHKVAEQCENISKEKAFEVTVDISKDDELKRAVDDIKKKFGKIDIVVNCAGILGNKRILDEDMLNVYDKVMGVNLRSIVAMTHYTAPALIESKGCIINIASVMAKMVSKGLLPYNVSKAAVVHFTKNVAFDLADKGVRVNSISPGGVETNVIIHSGGTQKESDELWESFAKVAPLRHNVDAKEIADMVVYLASDKARSITGADFKVDSGLVLLGSLND